MYLTRVEIDYQRHSSARELVFVEAIHNWVERSFPQEFTTKQRSRKLWRLDHLQGKNYLLIVSATKPDLQILEHMYGVSGSAQSKDYNAYLQQQLRLGARLRFRLALNPVIAKSSKGKMRNRTLASLLFLWMAMGLNAQGKVKVSGNVRDADGNPLELVAVQVKHTLIGVADRKSVV